MVKNGLKTALFSSLFLALLISFGGTNLVFGEMYEELIPKGLEGKQIWEKLEELKDKDHKTFEDKAYELDLQKQFDEIVKEMNKHGIASPEQWEADPDYWRMKNAPPFPTPSYERSASSRPDSFDRDGDTGVIPLPNTSPGYCPQEFRVIAGFDYLWSGFWPSSAFASEWQGSTSAPDELVSFVESRADHGEITPFIKYGLTRQGSASIAVEHVVENAHGITLSETDVTPYPAYRVISDHHTIVFDKVRNTYAGTVVLAIVELRTLS